MFRLPFFRPPPPAWYARHRAERMRPAALDAPRVVVLDTETSGFDRRRDRIRSLGAVAVRDGAVRLGECLRLVWSSPERPSRAEAVGFHGLTAEDRARGVAPAEALERLLDFLGPDPIVGHGLDFDRGMLDAALRREGAGRLRNAGQDTLRLAWRLDGVRAETARQGRYGLDALAARFGLPVEARHTALGDALLTAELWLALRARLRGGR